MLRGDQMLKKIMRTLEEDPYQIVQDARNSPEWQAISASFDAKRKELSLQLDKLWAEQVAQFQSRAQAMDEAGITSFKAYGWSFVRIQEEVKIGNRPD